MTSPPDPARPVASGRLTASGAVVFTRRLACSVDSAWAAVTDPARTARWIGPWTGDPGSGTVDLAMSVEEGAPTAPARILRCEPPTLLVVSVEPDAWVLTVRVEPGGAAGGAVVSLEHHIADAEAAAQIGPGWDYYLDRLVEAEAGRDPDTLPFSPDYFPGLSDQYRALLSP